MISSKQLARFGESHLEEAVLDVLLEVRHEEECIGAAEISRRTCFLPGFRRQGEIRTHEHEQRDHVGHTDQVAKEPEKLNVANRRTSEAVTTEDVTLGDSYISTLHNRLASACTGGNRQ